jgi:hypothetical protein
MKKRRSRNEKRFRIAGSDCASVITICCFRVEALEA